MEPGEARARGADCTPPARRIARTDSQITGLGGNRIGMACSSSAIKAGVRARH